MTARRPPQAEPATARTGGPEPFGATVWQASGVSGAAVVAALAVHSPAETVAPKAGPEADSVLPAQMRASSLTLVVFAPDTRALDEAARTVARLAGRHPSRVILVAPDAAASPHGIDARIRVEGHAREGAPVVRYEEIRLTMRRMARRHLTSLVSALLVQELPVFLLHLGALPWGGTWQREWSETVDRLVVDTREGVDALEDLEGLAALVAEAPSVSLGDVAFHRLLPWRTGLAEMFDPPAWRRRLGGIDGIEIAYPHGAAPTSGALLLAGWLADRLGWGRAGAGGSDYAVCEREGGDVRVVFSPAEGVPDDPFARSGVVGVTVYLRGADGEPPSTLFLEPDGGGLRFGDADGGRAGRVAVRAADEAGALARNLELVPDHAYAAALARAAGMAGALRRVGEAAANGG